MNDVAGLLFNKRWFYEQNPGNISDKELTCEATIVIQNLVCAWIQAFSVASSDIYGLKVYTVCKLKVSRSHFFCQKSMEKRLVFLYSLHTSK